MPAGVWVKEFQESGRPHMHLFLAIPDAVPDELFRTAQAPGHRLVGTVRMQHDDGMPRCAAVRPPVIEWTVDGE